MSERLHREQIAGLVDAAMVGVLENVDEERHRTRVMRRAEHLHDRQAALRLAGFDRVRQRRVGLVGADLHDRAESVALDRRLGIAEKRLEVGQRLAPAERAQQLHRRATDGRVRRAAQLIDVVAPGRAKTEQHIPEALHRAALFHRQRLGERFDRRRPQRAAERRDAS